MQDLDELLVTQERVRPGVPLAGMIDYVRAGGYFTRAAMTAHRLDDSPLIKISVFEDGRKFIHDGHHRCVAVHLGGRRFLREDECVVVVWTYADYATTNAERGYVTPFDPRTEVRRGDCADYKSEALRLFVLAAEGRLPLEDALAFVRSSQDRYKVPRQLWSVADLAATFAG